MEIDDHSTWLYFSFSLIQCFCDVVSIAGGILVSSSYDETLVIWDVENCCQKFALKVFTHHFNPLTPTSDWYPISPHHVTPESNIKDRRIKELIIN